MRRLSVGVSLCWFVTASAALAHHSYAMFDSNKTAVIEGTVKEFQWSNPHVWLEVVVAEGVRTGQWSFEGGTIALLKRSGWTRDSVKPGDKVKIVTHPLRNGSNGGSLMQVTFPDGKILYGGGRVEAPTIQAP